MSPFFHCRNREFLAYEGVAGFSPGALEDLLKDDRRIAMEICAKTKVLPLFGRWTFEIGGEGKKFGQIKDVPDSHVVNDGVELGYGNKIPLWLFGFLY